MSYHQHDDGGVGNILTDIGKFVKKAAADPIGTLVSAPGLIIDASAGGPQQRGRARTANKTAAQIRAEAASAQQSASDAAAQQAQQAAARVAALEAAAAAETAVAKKKLIKTVAIGGGAVAAVVGLGVLAWFITRD